MKKITNYFKKSFMGAYLFNKCKTPVRKSEYEELIKTSKDMFNQ